MEMILVVGIVATGWVFLNVLSGESKRLGQKFASSLPKPTDPRIESSAGQRAKSK